MDIDHIFIFTGNNGVIADELIALGFTEGGSRIHQGQGTANRTFVFENCYLEILWVYNEQEIKDVRILPTGLWTRANFKLNHCSPFGLCIANTAGAEQLFRDAFKYQPDYFPDGMTIDILNNDYNLDLPWTFRLPFMQDRQRQSATPTHKIGVKSLTSAAFYFPKADDGDFIEHFVNETAIKFYQSDNIGLTLTFDDGRQGRTNTIEPLKLIIKY